MIDKQMEYNHFKSCKEIFEKELREDDKKLADKFTKMILKRKDLIRGAEGRRDAFLIAYICASLAVIFGDREDTLPQDVFETLLFWNLKDLCIGMLTTSEYEKKIQEYRERCENKNED